MKTLSIACVAFLLFFCGKPVDLLFSGSVYTASLEPIKKAQVSLIDLASGEVLASRKSNAKGEFGLHVPLGTAYKVLFEKEGFASKQVHVDCSEYRAVENGYQFSRFRLVMSATEESALPEADEYMAYVYFNPEAGVFQYSKKPARQ